MGCGYKVHLFKHKYFADIVLRVININALINNQYIIDYSIIINCFEQG